MTISRQGRVAITIIRRGRGGHSVGTKKITCLEEYDYLAGGSGDGHCSTAQIRLFRRKVPKWRVFRTGMSIIRRGSQAVTILDGRRTTMYRNKIQSFGGKMAIIWRGARRWRFSMADTRFSTSEASGWRVFPTGLTIFRQGS